ERRDHDEGEVLDAPPPVEHVAGQEEEGPPPPVRGREEQRDHDGEEDDEGQRVEEHRNRGSTAAAVGSGYRVDAPPRTARRSRFRGPTIRRGSNLRYPRRDRRWHTPTPPSGAPAPSAAHPARRPTRSTPAPPCPRGDSSGRTPTSGCRRSRRGCPPSRRGSPAGTCSGR